MGVRQSMHYLQNTIERRYQEYAEFYFWGSMFQTQELVPLSNIDHVPVRFMYMEEDTVCNV